MQKSIFLEGEVVDYLDNHGMSGKVGVVVVMLCVCVRVRVREGLRVVRRSHYLDNYGMSG